MQTNAACEDYATILHRARVPTVLLSELGGPIDGVRVGTWARSKGLEFGHVYLPHAHALPGDEEQSSLERRTLYVAMARARDTFWMGRLRRCVTPT